MNKFCTNVSSVHSPTKCLVKKDDIKDDITSCSFIILEIERMHCACIVGYSVSNAVTANLGNVGHQNFLQAERSHTAVYTLHTECDVCDSYTIMTGMTEVWHSSICPKIH